MLGAVLVLALTAPAADQWSHLFDHGARWPGCTVTYSANVNGKPWQRAVRDIERASGVHLARVPSGGQITVTLTRERRPDRVAEALPWPTDGPYSSGFVTGFGDLRGHRGWYRRAVWRHELSHALGLGHSDDPLSPVYAGGVATRFPDRGPWVADLRTLYPECS